MADHDTKVKLHFCDLKIAEFFVFLVYKHLLEILFIPAYVSLWGYMFDNVSVVVLPYRIIISDCLLLVICLAYMLSKPVDASYDFAFKLLICMSIIPCLAEYSVNGYLNSHQVVYPFLYFLLVAVFINVLPRKCRVVKIDIKKVNHIDTIVLAAAFIFAVLFWAYMGFPVAIRLSDTYEQRMYMRTQSLPSIVNYMYLMLGNAIIPYLFVKALMNKKRVKAGISLITGILLFFLNGMKTWLLLYIIGLGLFICAQMFRNEYKKIVFSIESFFALAVCCSWGALKILGSNELLGQLGRILFIPANIGYKSVEFFSAPEHELLYLRESILKSFFASPYPGGSDFYMYYGANATLTSSRANNGLWGDAFRNFALVGMIIYPILLVLVLRFVINCMKNQKTTVRLFVVLLLVWSSINSSFFTWLLTGGIILLSVLLKTENDGERRINGYG